MEKRLGDYYRETIREVVRRIGSLDTGERQQAMALLATLAELRGLGSIVREEGRNMPITEDIMNHSIIGPARREGEHNMLRRLIRERFGDVPSWVEDRLERSNHIELEDFGVRLLAAAQLEDIFN